MPGRLETEIIHKPDGSIGIYGNGVEKINIDGTNGQILPVTAAKQGYGTGSGGAVAQGGSSATAVTLDKPTGQITTVALTTAAAAEEEFTVNNSLVAATDIIALSTTYAGAGTPILSVKGVSAGSFQIVISNVHAANALNAAMVINFAVIKGVAA